MNLMTHEAEEAIDKAKGARGRKDSTGSEAVIKTKAIEDRIADLCTLYERAGEAKDTYNDAAKAVAEAAGVHTSTVNKLVAARVGDKFDEINSKIQQLALIFEEVGPHKGSRGGTLA